MNKETLENLVEKESQSSYFNFWNNDHWCNRCLFWRISRLIH